MTTAIPVPNGQSKTPDYLLGFEQGTWVLVPLDAGPDGTIGLDTLTLGNGGSGPTVGDLTTGGANPLAASQGVILNGNDIQGAAIVGTNLVTTLKSGATLTTDITSLLADVKLSTLVYNSATKALDGTMSDASTFSVPVADLFQQAATAAPLAHGTAAVGTSLSYARQDHVHPSDAPLAATAAPAATAAASAVGASTKFAREDHVHRTVVAQDAASSILGDGGTTPLKLANDAAAPGNSRYYGTDGAGVKGFHPMPAGVAAGTLPGAAPALAGAAGVAAAFSREDHSHPFQGVSADAGNKIILGADGLHQFAGSGRVHATNTAVAPVVVGAPTVAEIAAAVTERDVIVYYTGDDLPASTPTYVYHVDSAGAVTLLEKPIASANSALKVIDPAMEFNLVFHTGESDVGTLADYSGPGGVLEVTGLNVASLDRTQIVILRNSGTGVATLAPAAGIVLTGDTTLLIGDVALILYSANGQAAHVTKLGGDVPASTLWGYSTTVETVDRAGVVGANNGSGSLVVHTGGAAAIEVQAIAFALTPNHTTIGLFRNSGTGVVTLGADASLTGGLTGDTSVPVGGIAIITYSANGNAAHVNVVGASAPPSYLVETITQAAHGLSFMNAVHHNGTAWVKSQANAAATVAQAVVVAVINANSFIVAYAGAVPVTAHGLTPGQYYWLDQATAGLLTATQPASGLIQPILFARSANQLLVNIGFALSI